MDSIEVEFTIKVKATVSVHTHTDRGDFQQPPEDTLIFEEIESFEIYSECGYELDDVEEGITEKLDSMGVVGL